MPTISTAAGGVDVGGGEDDLNVQFRQHRPTVLTSIYSIVHYTPKPNYFAASYMVCYTSKHYSNYRGFYERLGCSLRISSPAMEPPRRNRNPVVCGLGLVPEPVRLKATVEALISRTGCGSIQKPRFISIYIYNYMCIYVYMYCTYIYILYIYIHMSLCVYVYVNVYVYVYVCTCICMHMCAHTHTYMHACIHTYVHS